MNKVSYSALAIVVLSSCTAPTFERQALSAFQLLPLTQAGRKLLDYDNAAWNATDSVLAIGLDTSTVRMYVAVEQPSGWLVAFGRLSPDSNSFISAFDVDIRPDLSVAHVTKHHSGRTDTTQLHRAALALSIASPVRLSIPIQANSYVLPDTGDLFRVYFIPAPSDAGEIIIGPDFRVDVSLTQKHALSTVQFHKTSLHMKPPVGAAMAYHTHVLIDDPCETDVFYVLRQKERFPHFVVCPSGLYSITEDGFITSVREP